MLDPQKLGALLSTLLSAALFTACHAGCSPSRRPPELADDSAPTDAPSDRDAASDSRPRIVLLIGDGMGRELELAASRYATGTDEGLSWHGFEHRGELVTASASGITDSAAAATAMATGAVTYNGRLALDRDGVAPVSLFEIAARRGLATGIVTTATVSHASVAAFTATGLDRYDYRSIAEQQVRVSKPDVMLGGGRDDFAADLIAELEAAGAFIATDSSGLEASAASSGRLVGLFTGGQFPFVAARAVSSEIPDLPMMALAALERLDRDEHGFVVVIEAARIDRACHDRDLASAIGETLELDATALAVREWADAHPGTTVFLVADHETGGLSVVGPSTAGALPPVTWRWGNHSNARVAAYGSGALAASIDDSTVEPRTVYEVAAAAIESRPPRLPAAALIADGRLADLRFVAAAQTAASDIAPHGQLDRLLLDADRYGLAIGIEGTFSMSSSSLVVLLDRDVGSGVGAVVIDPPAGGGGSDPLDAVLSNLVLDFSPVAGFAADLAVVSVAGIEDSLETQWTGAGLRALDASGTPSAPPLAGVAINYDEGVRAGQAPATRRSGSGAEIFVPFDRLFPGTSAAAGAVPVGARVGVYVLLSSVLGTSLSNQALPGLADGQISGVALIELDIDRDGTPGEAPRVSVISAAAGMP